MTRLDLGDLGLDRGGHLLVKRALAEKRSLMEVALEEKVLPEADLRRVLDPLPMTRGGVQA